jgi:N-acetyl-D-muramate 6-phosphate phosphatase
MRSALDLKRIQAVCFDIDGTIADTDDDYVRLVASKLRPFRRFFSEQDPTAFARNLIMFIETPANFLSATADRLGIDQAAEAVKRRFSRPQPGHITMINGVPETLESIGNHFKLAIVTAREERGSLRFLNDHNLRRYFPTIATAHTCWRTKPHPAPILWAAEQMGVPAENCLMVGDTTVDILAGKRAGAQTVGLLCGFGTRWELERSGADLILDAPLDLMHVLLPAV